MISFAQNFEDVILNRYFGGRTHGFYIDVGAWMPTRDSVTKHFYNMGWSGINIEPAPDAFAALCKDRPRDVNLNCVVASATKFEGKTGPFYHFPDTGLSTTEPEISAEWSRRGWPLHQIERQSLTLAEICGSHAPQTIDFMKIDVEGCEAEVVGSNDWSVFRPLIVLIEAVDPIANQPSTSVWEPMLLGQGYRFLYFDGLNRFYGRVEDDPVQHSRLAVPPNVFDGFTIYHPPAEPVESSPASPTKAVDSSDGDHPGPLDHD